MKLIGANDYSASIESFDGRHIWLNLTKAILIATKAHDGQIDKGGNPYILHPLRMMTRAYDNDTRIVSVLHDVVEDTDWTIEMLRGEGFSEVILAAVDCMTRRKEESYEEFIFRCRGNVIARKVKLLDLDDNSDISRIANPTEKDYSRLKRYSRAINLLKD